MQELMNTNIYDVDYNIAIIGSCLKRIHPIIFDKLEAEYDNIYSVCLEETHINMIITKIGSMIRTGKIKKIAFISVDKSPHCIQLHYIQDELNKMMDLSKIEIKNYIINDNIIEISKDTISLSKNLQELEKITQKTK
jgi:hypothetical protein